MLRHHTRITKGFFFSRREWHYKQKGMSCWSPCLYTLLSRFYCADAPIQIGLAFSLTHHVFLVAFKYRAILSYSPRIFKATIVHSCNTRKRENTSHSAYRIEGNFGLIEVANVSLVCFILYCTAQCIQLTLINT